MENQLTYLQEGAWITFHRKFYYPRFVLPKLRFAFFINIFIGIILLFYKGVLFSIVGIVVLVVVSSVAIILFMWPLCDQIYNQRIKNSLIWKEKFLVATIKFANDFFRRYEEEYKPQYGEKISQFDGLLKTHTDKKQKAIFFLAQINPKSPLLD